MRPSHALLLLVSAVLSASGLDATAYFSTGCGGTYTLYAVDVANGGTRGLLRTSQLGGYGLSRADLSPDGLRVALGVKGGSGTRPSIWIVNNDGTGLRKIADCPYKNGWGYSGLDGLAFTSAGIYWIPSDRDTTHDAHEVYLTNPETGSTAVAYRVSGADPSCDMVALKSSNDGRRQIVWTPHDTVMNDAEHATRGPLVSLDATGAVTQTRWFHAYETAAHGYGMSPSGAYVYVVPFSAQTAAGCTWNGYHSCVVVRRWSDGQIEKCVQRTVPQYLGGTLDPSDGFNMATCRNSEDHYAIGNAHPTYGCNGWWYIVNWRTEEVTKIAPDTTVFPYSTQDIKNDSLFWCGSCIPLMTWWLGTLPSATTPAIAASPRLLNFTDAVRPVPTQSLAVSNSGVGTLSAVTASVSSGAAGWLSAAVSGSGNSQTVTVTSAPETLAAGAYQGTITLSGGGANNSVDIAVTLNVGTSINAPSNCAAAMASDSNVTLTWTDNSGNEAGFRLERASDSAGPWQQVATVGANVVTGTLHLSTLDAIVYFRVRAYSGSANSGYSNVASVYAPVPRKVFISRPAGGDTIRGGQVYRLQWTATGGVDLVDLQYTFDGGENWVRFVVGGVVMSNGQGFFDWTMPDTSATASVRVWPYGESPGVAAADEVGPFTIVRRTALVGGCRSGGLPGVTQLRGSGRVMANGALRLACDLAPGDRAVVRIYRLNGSLVAELPLPTQAGTHMLNWNSGGHAGVGCYLARLVKTW